MNKNVLEYLEKYLLVIWKLNKKEDKVTLQDIACYMNISENNVLKAIKILKDLEYITEDLSLTKNGEDTAELITYRHNTIVKFLNSVLEIDENSAHENATKMQYALSENVLAKITHFFDYIESCTNIHTSKSCGNSSCNGCKNCSD